MTECKNGITEVRGGRGSPEDLQLHGKFRVIDPCYVPALDDRWDELSDMWAWTKGQVYDDPNGHDWVSFKLDGHLVVMWGTAYGDGVYPVFKGEERIGLCGVDSGKLAFVPVELCADAFDGADVTLSGRFEYDNGDVEVGKVRVITRDLPDE